MDRPTISLDKVGREVSVRADCLRLGDEFPAITVRGGSVTIPAETVFALEMVGGDVVVNKGRITVSGANIVLVRREA